DCPNRPRRRGRGARRDQPRVPRMHGRHPRQAPPLPALHEHAHAARLTRQARADRAKTELCATVRTRAGDEQKGDSTQTTTAPAEWLLASIVEGSDDAIIAKDLDGVIIVWNPAAERIFGYSAEEALGRNIEMLIPEDHRG